MEFEDVGGKPILILYGIEGVQKNGSWEIAVKFSNPIGDH